MKFALNRISRKFSGIFSMLFNISAKQADDNNKRLIKYIVELNQKKKSDEIINEASLCLKDIVNYRLFAVVIKNEKEIDVWLDPRMYKSSLETIIMGDFSIKNKKNINYINHSFDKDEQEKKFSMKNLVSYDLMEEDCMVKVYMVPGRNMLNYHDDIVNVILKSTGVALSRQMKIAKLDDAARLDPLTRCYNRREFETQINRNIARAARHRTQLSVFMFDIDHFKKVNDTYGHQAGDEVLKAVSALARDNMRADDVLARYGGEEFFAILPGTGKREAMELSDRIRRMISKQSIATSQGNIRVTASFGVASLSGHADAATLIEDADAMMYKAKLNGRNTVMPGLIKICSEENSSCKNVPMRSVNH